MGYTGNNRIRLEQAIEDASDTRARFAFALAYALYVWRIIPTLQPHQLLIPTTLLQIAVFVVTALNPTTFLQNFIFGSFVIVGIAMFPSTFPRPARREMAHWVRP